MLQGHFVGLSPLTPDSLLDSLLLLPRFLYSNFNVFENTTCLNWFFLKYLLLVDPEGFEPSTSSMPLRRAPNCAMGPLFFPAGTGSPSRTSGPGGIRTRDLFSAIEARSHCATGPGLKVAELYLSAYGLSRNAIFGAFLVQSSQKSPLHIM